SSSNHFMEKTRIGIIGGGLSGSLLAIHLLRYCKQPLELFVFERSPEQLCRGVAYSSRLPYQLLNVPVKGMSLFEEEPLHFLHWLKRNRIEAGEDDFVSRKCFGDYVTDIFQRTINENEVHRMHILTHEVIDMDLANEARLLLANGQEITVTQVY